MIKIHLNSCFSTDFLLFPSSKTQSWPVGLVVMMVAGIGHLAVRNQSRSLYTVITFPNPHAKFPFASSSSSSFSSTFPLPWSLSPPLPLPLLCFHFPLLSLIFDPAETLRFQFLQLSQPSAVYIPFSTVSYPALQPLVSPPCPLLLLPDYSPRLTLLWHTLSSQMKETLSDCWSLTRAHCASVCLCVFLQLWSEILKMREESKQDLFVLNTWRRRIKDLSMDNQFIQHHLLDLPFRGRLLSRSHGMVLIKCSSAGHTAGSGFTVWCALRFNTLVNMKWLHVISHQSSHYV